MVSHLNFQQSEYQSGSLTKFDVVNIAPERLRSVAGVVQEWLSHEVGLVAPMPLDQEVQFPGLLRGSEDLLRLQSSGKS